MERASEERRRLVVENQDMLIDFLLRIPFHSKHISRQIPTRTSRCKATGQYAVDAASVEARVMICVSFARRSRVLTEVK